MTPVEAVPGGMWLKRDDTYRHGAARGGKARSVAAYVARLRPTGLVSYGSRESTQIAVVAQVAQAAGLPCQIHIPWSSLPDSPGIAGARAAGAHIRMERPGYLSVLAKRARESAAALGHLFVPSGPAVPDAVEATASEVGNLPRAAARVVVPVGSGMSLAGILAGLARRPDMAHVRVLGVVCGADPEERLDAYAPLWRMRCNLVSAEVPYKAHVDAVVGDTRLDPVYEAKCVAFLRSMDLLWCVGTRGE